MASMPGSGTAVPPEVVLPEVVLPDVVLPDVVLPEVVLPEVVLPEVVLPEVLVLQCFLHGLVPPEEEPQLQVADAGTATVTTDRAAAMATSL